MKQLKQYKVKINGEIYPNFDVNFERSEAEEFVRSYGIPANLEIVEI